jgi:3-oxoadipate enol-lactonase
MTIARRTGTLARPDCSIHYEVVGKGPAMVFAHGLGGNLMSWFQQVAHFAPRFTCVAFSHRGFGRSTSPTPVPDPAQFAGDLGALIDHLDLKDIRLVAQSMGGWTAVEYALSNPGRLRAVVLACTTGTVDPYQIEEPELSRLPKWIEKEFSKSPALFAKGVHPAAGERMAKEQPAKHLLYWQIDEQNGALDRATLGARLMTMRQRAPQDLARIGCPIRFISGNEDVVIPPFAADAIARVVPNASVAHVPEAGHSVYFERPEAFNQVLDDFFAGL